jgi:hypothetical protein
MSDAQLISLLTEYAQNPARTLEEVAIKLQLSLAHARRLMKKFAYAMASAVEDKDYPRKPAEKLGISEDIAIALESHVDQYADMKILEELKRRGPSFNANQMGGMAADMVGGGGMDDESNATALSGSTPTKILHYILTYLYRKKVNHYEARAFIDLFRLDEEMFMNQPIKLEQKLRDQFGNTVGTAIFSQFYDMVQTRLGPSQQFGGPQWGGGGGFGNFSGGGSPPPSGGYSGGSRGYSNSYTSFYQAKGVIPSGVDPESPEARRAIEEYENEKRERRQQEAIANQMKQLLNARMTEMIDPKNMYGGGGGGMGGMGGMMNGIGIAPYIASGNIRMVIREGQNGKPEQVLEAITPGSGHLADGGGDPTTNAMQKMYETMTANNNQMNQFIQPVLQQLVQKGMGGGGFDMSNPVSMIQAFKEVANAINPPGQVQQSIDMARLMIAEKRIENDKDVALKTLESKRVDENADKSWAHEQEKMSFERQNTLVDTVVNQGLKSFGPIIEAIVAAKLGPKMPPGMMPNGAGGMPPEGAVPDGYYGGGGAGGAGGGPSPDAPPMRMPGRQVDEEDLLRYTAGQGAGAGAANMTEGQRAVMEAARMEKEARERLDRQEMERQQAWAAVSRAKTYTPQDFTAFTDDQLDAYEQEGRSWRDSADNFNDAVRKAKYERMLTAKRRGEAVVPTLSQPIASPGGITPAPQGFGGAHSPGPDPDDEFLQNARDIGAPDQSPPPGANKPPPQFVKSREPGVPEPMMDLADPTNEETDEVVAEVEAEEAEEKGEYEESEVEFIDRGDIA